MRDSEKSIQGDLSEYDVRLRVLRLNKAISTIVDLQDGQSPTVDDFAGLLEPIRQILVELKDAQPAPVCLTRDEARAIAEGCADAYSADRFSYPGWRQCGVMLAARGFDEFAIEEILRSKWTRWACDHCDNHSYGHHTSPCLERYLDRGKPGIGIGNWRRLMYGGDRGYEPHTGSSTAT